VLIMFSANNAPNRSGAECHYLPFTTSSLTFRLAGVD